ncbi:MAG: GntR family transcriptional regulator [Clostridia bacterium]|nr:GntR family transcriptional regulator [Clostridia bacterium]
MFSPDNNSPIYLQIAEKIKSDIVSGELSPGARLPSVRDLALKLKVNPNTVQKALAELEMRGLLFTERTNGKFVTHDTGLIISIKNDYAKNIAESFLSSMEKLGFSNDEAINYLSNLGGEKN